MRCANCGIYCPLPKTAKHPIVSTPNRNVLFDLDLLISTNGGPAYLYRNDGGNANRWLRIKTVGSQSNRDGIGAVVQVRSPGGAQWQMVRSGSSYCSQSELTLTFGLGRDAKVEALEVRWPSGRRTSLRGVETNQSLVLEEDK